MARLSRLKLIIDRLQDAAFSMDEARRTREDITMVLLPLHMQSIYVPELMGATFLLGGTRIHFVNWVIEPTIVVGTSYSASVE
jgi:hypothetical protein